MFILDNYTKNEVQNEPHFLGSIINPVDGYL